MKLYSLLVLLLLCSLPYSSKAQDSLKRMPSNAGWFSLGYRSTISLFDDDGAGWGTGGQYRLQFSRKVNSDWFADYISININDKIRSEFYHIGWSVMYYPFTNRTYPKVLQPYIVAGHCFDYNIKTVIANTTVHNSRWGSAVQAGLGTHINITERFDFSLTSQYMIHLTPELVTVENGNTIDIIKRRTNSIEGHLLTTLSMNIKLIKLWKTK